MSESLSNIHQYFRQLDDAIKNELWVPLSSRELIKSLIKEISNELDTIDNKLDNIEYEADSANKKADYIKKSSDKALVEYEAVLSVACRVLACGLYFDGTVLDFDKSDDREWRDILVKQALLEIDEKKASK